MATPSIAPLSRIAGGGSGVGARPSMHATELRVVPRGDGGWLDDHADALGRLRSNGRLLLWGQRAIGAGVAPIDRLADRPYALGVLHQPRAPANLHAAQLAIGRAGLHHAGQAGIAAQVQRLLRLAVHPHGDLAIAG